MRVMQVLPTLSGGGAEGFIANLCVSLVKAGIETELHILSNVRDARGKLLFQRLKDNNVGISGNRSDTIKDFRIPGSFLRAVNSFNPDFVQANLHSSEIIVATVRPLIKSKPKFIRRLANSRSLGITNEILLRWMDQSFDLTIACSDVVRDFYEHELRFSKKSVGETILNGSVLRRMPPTSEERIAAREQLSLPLSSRIFVHIGRMGPLSRKEDGLDQSQKAHDVLLQAFGRAFSGDMSKVLLLVGDGDHRGRLEELAAALNLTQQVRFLGLLPEPWPALVAADIFVFPSRFEGHPNVIPEAISCGLPLLISDIRENREMLIGSANRAISVNDVEGFADAMIDFDKDYEALREEANAVAPIMFSEKSMDTCAERYIAAFHNIAGR